MTSERSWLEWLFRAGVWLKGLDGAGQLLAGVVLLFIPLSVVGRIAHAVVTRDLLGSPHGPLAMHFETTAAHFASGGTRGFLITYLLLHGVIKLALVVALLREVVPLYPVACVALAAFVVFEFLRAAETHSIPLIVFGLIDVVIIALVLREYFTLRARRKASTTAD